MPFDREGDADAPFAFGFECGRIYALVGNLIQQQEDEAWGDLMPLTVHAENAEMMLRIAERYLCAVTSADLNDDWLAVTFYPPADAR